MRTNAREKRMAHFKHLYHHQTIQRNTEMLFTNDARFPFTILAVLPWSFASCSLRRVESESRFLRTLYASFPRICVQPDPYAHYTQKFALTRLLYLPSYQRRLSLQLVMTLKLRGDEAISDNCFPFSIHQHKSLFGLPSKGPNQLRNLVTKQPHWDGAEKAPVLGQIGTFGSTVYYWL